MNLHLPPIMAAKQFGVAKDLIEYLQSQPVCTLNLSRIPSSQSSHPSSQERINYLMKYANRLSLFKSEEISQQSNKIHEPDEKMEIVLSPL